MSDYVEKVLNQQTGFEDRDDAEVVKEQLREYSYDGVLDYINHRDSEDVDEFEFRRN